MSIRQAIKTIACELINANRIRLAEIELRRVELALLERVTKQVESSAVAGQAAAQFGPQMESLLAQVVQRFVGPEPTRASHIQAPNGQPPEPVVRESEGMRVSAEAPQQ